MNSKPFTILYEDKHVLVCIKPAGTATQSKRIGSPDMVSLLKNHIAVSCQDYTSGQAQKEPYLGIIHRLDQPVQGIMVFAKTPFAARELSRQMQQKGFGKYYRALVENRPEKSADTLTNYMAKDGRTNTSRICTKDVGGAKLARLSYQIVTKPPYFFSQESYSELDIHLDTGRHHQIRVQLANLGCPLVGDTKYNPSCTETTGWQELKLCSYRLTFIHPKTKKSMTFSLID